MTFRNPDIGRLFVNDPDTAAEIIKDQIRSLKEGDEMLVFSPVPRQLERSLRMMAKRRGVRLTFSGRSYNVHVTTVEDRARERQRAEDDRQAHEDWINSPG